MYQRMTSVCVTAAVALATLAVSGATASAAAASAAHPVAGAFQAAVPGAQLWAKRYNGPGGAGDNALSVAAAPGGGRVFVTGSSLGAGSDEDYATVAYSAATGARLWVKRYNGPGNGFDIARSVAVSPSGKTVYVTGSSPGAGSPGNSDYATVAYSAATGAQLWVKRYNGPANGDDRAVAIAASPTGSAVFVTGSSAGATTFEDYATVAYSATTGARLWVKRFAGSDTDSPVAVAVSPDGGRVFVTGSSVPANGLGGADYLTIAYRASTGGQLWLRRFAGTVNPDEDNDTAAALAVSPTGDKVFVTGSSFGPDGDIQDYTTLGYNAATGTRLWLSRYNNGAEDTPTALAVSPSGSTVYITGASDSATSTDAATVAIRASTGGQLWAKRYNGPANGLDRTSAITVGPTGTVFVTGSSAGLTTGTDYITIAYSG